MLLLQHSPYYPLIILSCKKIHVYISFSNLTTTIFFFFRIIRYSNGNLKLKKRKHDNRDEKHVQTLPRYEGVRVSGSHGLPRIFRRTTDFPRQKREVRERNGSVFHARER